MTIDEAIEYLETEEDIFIKKGFEHRAMAQRLGIEALKRVRNERINPGAYRDLPLPGETKEE